MYSDFFVQNLLEFFGHGQVVKDDAQGFGIVGPVDEGGIRLTAPLAGLEVLCARAAQECCVPILVGSQSSVPDALIRDAFVVCAGAQDTTVTQSIKGLVPQTPGDQKGIDKRIGAKSQNRGNDTPFDARSHERTVNVQSKNSHDDDGLDDETDDNAFLVGLVQCFKVLRAAAPQELFVFLK